MIRVGTCSFDKRKRAILPVYEGFTPIVIMTYCHSNEYYTLGPYALKDDKGRIMENVWQFSKIYEHVPETTQHYSTWNKTVVWSYHKEQHIDENGNILPAYWEWRKLGMNREYHVRYPVGKDHMSKCIYAIPEDNLSQKLDYVDSRRKIYIPVYCQLAKKEQTCFPELQERLKNGENLLIIEVDGPRAQSLEYYKDKYFVSDNFIENDTMLATKENLTIMAFDTKHPFGHGYCLAMALLGIDEELLESWDKIKPIK